MTRNEALTDLLAMVEAGSVDDWRPYYKQKLFGPKRSTLYAVGAYDGRLDAAKALHEAVLPGWTWNVAQAQGYAWAMTYGHVGLYIERIEVQAETPARAWLIAIIKALIAKDDT